MIGNDDFQSINQSLFKHVTTTERCKYCCDLVFYKSSCVTDIGVKPIALMTFPLLSPSLDLKGTLLNYDDDGKKNVKKAIGLLSKTTTLHVHHAFLYISLLSLHNYDLK